MTLFFIAAPILAAFAVAVALVRYGLKGRRIDDHPVCRACRFDLFNLPSDRTTCPECGADLRGPGAVRVGNRRRREGPLYSGLTLLLVAALAAALVVTAVAKRVDVYRYAPDAWVERDTRAPQGALQRKAWAELSRRFGDGGLSEARAARLVDAALDRQADRKTAWVDEIGDFVEAVHKADKLPRDKWLRYAMQAPNLWLRTRPKVGRGDPIVAEIVEDGDRVAADSLLLVRPVEAHARGDLLAERDAPQEFKGFGSEQIGTGSFRAGVEVDEDRAAMKAAPAGEHTVEVAVTIEVHEGHELNFQNQKHLLRDRKELKADFELLDREAAAFEVIPDDSPDLRKKVEAAIQIVSATVLPESGYIFIRDSAKSPPVPLAFRVTVRQGGRQWQGKRTYDAGGNSNGAFFVPEKDFPGDKLDVIMEPDPDTARDTIDMPGLWNGRLEFRDVPIQRPAPPAAQR